MTVVIFVLAFWVMAMALTIFVFCGAAREYVSNHEGEPVPVWCESHYEDR